MKRLILTILMFLLFPPQAYADLKAGVYFCYTEKQVGIQGEEFPQNIENTNKLKWMMNNRYAGLTKPKKEKFIIKIKKVGEEAYELELPLGRLSEIDKLNGIRILTSSSSLPNLFIGEATTFLIYESLSFFLSYLNGFFGNYVEEGKCETFEE